MSTASGPTSVNDLVGGESVALDPFSEVPSCFLQPDFDVVAYEIEQLQNAMKDHPKDKAAEDAYYDSAIAQRDRFHDAVYSRLNKHCLDNRSAFTSGISDIQAASRAVDRSTALTFNGRRSIARASEALTGGVLRVLALARRQVAVRSTARLVILMQRTVAAEARIRTLIAEGDLAASVAALASARADAAPLVPHIPALREMVTRWDTEYASALISRTDEYIRGLARKYSPRSLVAALVSYRELDLVAHVGQRVGVLFADVADRVVLDTVRAHAAPGSVASGNGDRALAVAIRQVGAAEAVPCVLAVFAECAEVLHNYHAVACGVTALRLQWQRAETQRAFTKDSAAAGTPADGAVAAADVRRVGSVGGRRSRASSRGSAAGGDSAASGAAAGGEDAPATGQRWRVPLPSADLPPLRIADPQQWTVWPYAQLEAELHAGRADLWARVRSAVAELLEGGQFGGGTSSVDLFSDAFHAAQLFLHFGRTFVAVPADKSKKSKGAGLAGMPPPTPRGGVSGNVLGAATGVAVSKDAEAILAKTVTAFVGQWTKDSLARVKDALNHEQWTQLTHPIRALTGIHGLDFSAAVPAASLAPWGSSPAANGSAVEAAAAAPALSSPTAPGGAAGGGDPTDLFAQHSVLVEKYAQHVDAVNPFREAAKRGQFDAGDAAAAAPGPQQTQQPVTIGGPVATASSYRLLQLLGRGVRLLRMFGHVVPSPVMVIAPLIATYLYAVAALFGGPPPDRAETVRCVYEPETDPDLPQLFRHRSYALRELSRWGADFSIVSRVEQDAYEATLAEKAVGARQGAQAAGAAAVGGGGAVGAASGAPGGDDGTKEKKRSRFLGQLTGLTGQLESGLDALGDAMGKDKDRAAKEIEELRGKDSAAGPYRPIPDPFLLSQTEHLRGLLANSGSLFGLAQRVTALQSLEVLYEFVAHVLGSDATVRLLPPSEVANVRLYHHLLNGYFDQLFSIIHWRLVRAVLPWDALLAKVASHRYEAGEMSHASPPVRSLLEQLHAFGTRVAVIEGAGQFPVATRYQGAGGRTVQPLPALRQLWLMVARLLLDSIVDSWAKALAIRPVYKDTSIVAALMIDLKEVARALELAGSIQMNAFAPYVHADGFIRGLFLDERKDIEEWMEAAVARGCPYRAHVARAVVNYGTAHSLKKEVRVELLRNAEATGLVRR